MKNKYYVVWKGHKKGIFESWNDCKSAITNFSNAKYKSFKSYEEAKFAYENPDKYIDIEDMNDIEIPCIVVDASHLRNKDLMEYRGLLLPEKTELFRKGPFKGATNNIGEFIAIVHALAYMEKNGIILPVYTDSNVALTWIKKKNPKINKNISKEVLLLVQRASKWLEEHDISKYKIKKWNTRILGENPADFGRK